MSGRLIYAASVLVLAGYGCGFHRMPPVKSIDITKDVAFAWCAKYEHLPIYPTAKEFYLVTSDKGADPASVSDQCGFSTTDEFATVNDWYVDALTRGHWSQWKLLRYADAPKDNASYALEKEPGKAQIGIDISRDAKRGRTNVLFDDISGSTLQNYVPVKHEGRL